MLKRKKYIVKIYDNDRFLGTPYFRKKYFRINDRNPARSLA